jgi:hypothetical protein
LNGSASRRAQRRPVSLGARGSTLPVLPTYLDPKRKIIEAQTLKLNPLPEPNLFRTWWPALVEYVVVQSGIPGPTIWDIIVKCNLREKVYPEAN